MICKLKSANQKRRGLLVQEARDIIATVEVEIDLMDKQVAAIADWNLTKRYLEEKSRMYYDIAYIGYLCHTDEQEFVDAMNQSIECAKQAKNELGEWMSRCVLSQIVQYSTIGKDGQLHMEHEFCLLVQGGTVDAYQKALAVIESKISAKNLEERKTIEFFVLNYWKVVKVLSELYHLTKEEQYYEKAASYVEQMQSDSQPIKGNMYYRELILKEFENMKS